MQSQYNTCMQTRTLSWLQNYNNRGFSVDQLKGKQLLLMFRLDALVIFRAKSKLNVSPKDD